MRTEKWTRPLQAELQNGRAYHSSCSINMTVYVFGGIAYSEALKSIEWLRFGHCTFEPQSDRWQSCTPLEQMEARYNTFMFSLNDEQILIVGG